MKAKIGFLASLLLAGFITVNAQGGPGGPQRTVEERVKMVMEKLADLKLDKDQTAKTDTIFATTYRSMDKKRQEMREAGGAPDREKMMAEMQKSNQERDEKLKAVFTADQFKKFKDEIEPTLRPQRGGNRQ